MAVSADPRLEISVRSGEVGIQQAW